MPNIMPLKFKAQDAPNTIMGMAILTIPAVLNALCNPVISVKSDRCRSRWGRRIPFIAGTLPALVLCLFALAFSDKIGVWAHGHLGRAVAGFSPKTVTIAVMAICMTLFSFFNTFVNSVFWYLFNDVVPEHLMARFMSWFRMAGMGASAIYSLCIFPYAKTHSTEILGGIAIVYCLGFGLMCFNVKEGEYPPPEPFEGEDPVVITAIKAYIRECFCYPHYWYIFLANMGLAIGYASSLFSIFFTQGMNLSFTMIGRLSFIGNVAYALYIPVSGWLADRYHPIRVVLAGAILAVFVVPINLLWLALATLADDGLLGHGGE